MKMKRHIKTNYLFLVITIVAGGLFSSRAKCQNTTTNKDFLDLSARATSVSPAQNFFEYANGTWLKNTPIPADKVAWGSVVQMNEKVLGTNEKHPRFLFLFKESGNRFSGSTDRRFICQRYG